jgi:WD40 repeat protein
MKATKILGTALLLALGISSSVEAQAAAGISPQNRSLTIPIWFAAPAAAPSPSPAASAPTSLVPAATPDLLPALECTVSCGTALPLSGVAFSPDGKALAVGGYKEVLLWDLVEGKLAKRIGAGQIGTMVQAVVFGKDGKTLAVAEGTPYGAGAVKVFDLQTGQVAMNFQEPKGVVYSLALSPDGKILVAGCSDAATYVWSLEERKLVTTLKDQTLAVVSVSFSADGKFLATASLDKTIQVWDATTWKAGRSKTTVEAPVHRCFIRSVRGSPADRSFMFGLVVGGHDNRTVQLCLDDQAPAWAKHDLKVEMDAGSPLDCVWLKDKDPSKWYQFHVYVAASDATVKVYTETGKAMELTTTLRGHGDWVYAVTASADEKTVASASGDGSVKLWSSADDSLLATLVQLSPGKDDWLIVSGQGYFATSTPAAVQWRASGAKASPEKLSGLQNPELVRQALAGKKVPPPVLQ